MLLPQLHDELASAARRPRPLRRRSNRTARAVAAALLTLLVAAPTAQAGLAGPPIAKVSTTGHTS
jgi:hypothetical protein